MRDGRGLSDIRSSSDYTHRRAVVHTRTVTCSVLYHRVAQLIIHGRKIVSCTSEMQSVVGWKIAMAGPQKRLRFSLGYRRKVNIC